MTSEYDILEKKIIELQRELAALRRSEYIARAGRAGDADTVDGHHAGNTADNVLVLDGAGLVPLADIPAHAGTHEAGGADVVDADTVDGYHAAASGADAHVIATDASGNATISGSMNLGPTNPIVARLAATNESANVAGSPRLALINLEMDYDGANDVSESAAIPLFGGDIVARDARFPTILAAHVTYAATGAQYQARSTVYAPMCLDTGGAYQALTPSDTAVANTGYTYTTEIKGNSGGNVYVRTTRTGGSTAVAKIHVALVIAI